MYSCLKFFIQILINYWFIYLFAFAFFQLIDNLFALGTHRCTFIGYRLLFGCKGWVIFYCLAGITLKLVNILILHNLIVFFKALCILINFRFSILDFQTILFFVRHGFIFKLSFILLHILIIIIIYA